MLSVLEVTQQVQPTCIIKTSRTIPPIPRHGIANNGRASCLSRRPRVVCWFRNIFYCCQGRKCPPTGNGKNACRSCIQTFVFRTHWSPDGIHRRGHLNIPPANNALERKKRSSSTKHQASSIKHQASSIKHQASSIKHQASNIKHQASSIKHQASSIKQHQGIPRHPKTGIVKHVASVFCRPATGTGTKRPTHLGSKNSTTFGSRRGHERALETKWYEYTVKQYLSS